MINKYDPLTDVNKYVQYVSVIATVISNYPTSPTYTEARLCLNELSYIP